MDDRRFDDLARSLAAGGTSRRRLLSGAAAAVAGAFGGVLGRFREDVHASHCGTCPPGQVARPGCTCVCRTTGRPPGPDGCPCPRGQERCGETCCRFGQCIDDSVCCPAGTERCGLSCCPGECLNDVTCCAVGPACGTICCGEGQECVADGVCCLSGESLCGTECCTAERCINADPDFVCCPTGFVACGLGCCNTLTSICVSGTTCQLI